MVVLTNQAPQRDEEVPSAVNRAISHYGERLVAVSGEEVVKLELAGEPYRLFDPRSHSVFGLYDHAAVYLADDIEHVLEVTGHMGAASREYLVGPLPPDLKESDRAARVLRTLLPSPDSVSPPPLTLIGVHVMKIGDHLSAAFGPRLRCAVLDWIKSLANDAVDVLAIPSWASTDIYVVSTHRDPTTIQPFINKLHSLTVGDLGGQQVEHLFDLARRGVDHLIANGFGGAGAGKVNGGSQPLAEGVVAAQILGAWKNGPWAFRERKGRLTFGEVTGCDVWYAARLHLARNLPCNKSPQLDADPQGGSAKTITAVYLVQAKPGRKHLDVVRLKLDEIAQQWRAQGREAKVLRSFDGEHVRPLLRLHGPATMKVVEWIAYYSRALRTDLSHDIVDVSTSLDLDLDVGEVATVVEARDGHTNDTKVKQGYELLGPSNLQGIEHLERFLLTRLGYGASERQAMLGFLSGVRHDAGDRDVFGALLEPLQVVELIRRELLGLVIKPTIEQSDILHEQLHQMMKFGQIALQQRIQYTPLARGGLQIVAEVPFGINQLAMMMSGLTEVVLGLAYERSPEDHELHDVTYEPHDVRRRGVVLTLFGQDNTFAIRQIGRLAVLRMNLVAAGSPLAMSLLFHELGHHIEMICAMSPRDKAIRVERRSKWKGDINDLVAQVVAEAAQPKASQENKRAPHDTKWIRESLEAMLEEHFAHTTWRKIGCKDDWKVFEAQFLSCFAMGYVQRKQFGVGEEWTNLWASSLAQLYIQECDHAGNVARLYPHDRNAIMRWVVRYWRWWKPQCDTSADDIEIAESLISLVEILVSLFGAVLKKLNRSICARFDALERELGKITALLDCAQADEAMGLVDDAGFSNAAVNSEDGMGLIDDAGFSTPKAFIRCREAIINFTRMWNAKVIDESIPSTGNEWRTTRRDPVTQKFVAAGFGSTRPSRGFFADITGRMFVFGADDRRWWNEERNRTLNGLMDVAQHVRAGRMMRHFMYRRELVRFDWVEACTLTVAGVPTEKVHGLIVDVSSGGLRVLVRERPSQSFKLNKLVELSNCDAFDAKTDPSTCILRKDPTQLLPGAATPHAVVDGLLADVVRLGVATEFDSEGWYSLHLSFAAGTSGFVGASRTLRPDLFFVSAMARESGEVLDERIRAALADLQSRLNPPSNATRRGSP